MLVYGDLAVIARSGADAAPSRRQPPRAAVAGQGYRITHITAPGTLDGGDVLKIGRPSTSASAGGRTTRASPSCRDALRAARGRGRTVPVRKVLHLKCAVTALPDGTVIGYLPLVDDPAAFDSFLEVPEEPGSHVVLLGGGPC